MTRHATPDKRPPALEPVDEAVDHVRGPASGHLILEYGDYECPYSRQAFRQVELLERELGGEVRFAFRHFPLTGIHPHALAPGQPSGHAQHPAQRPARRMGHRCGTLSGLLVWAVAAALGLAALRGSATSATTSSGSSAPAT